MVTTHKSNYFLLPSLTICLDMEQFVLVLASVNDNNKNLKTQAVKKQEFPRYQTEQNPTYQTDSLKTEINKKVLAKADPLVDKILSFPSIKLSNSYTFILDGAESGFLLSAFARQFRRKYPNVPEL